MLEKKFEVKIDRIELVNFSIMPIPKTLNVPPTEFNFTINITNRVIPAHKLIVQQLDISMDLVEIKGEVVSTLSVLIGYLINNFEECVNFNSEDSVYTIDKDLDLMMRNISLGTTRGIFYSKLQGSYLGRAYMPIILTGSFQTVSSPAN